VEEESKEGENPGENPEVSKEDAPPAAATVAPPAAAAVAESKMPPSQKEPPVPSGPGTSDAKTSGRILSLDMLGEEASQEVRDLFEKFMKETNKAERKAMGRRGLQRDAVLVKLLKAYALNCFSHNMWESFEHALVGVVSGLSEQESLGTIYARHNGSPKDPKDSYPPVSDGTTWFPPGEAFKVSAIVAVQIMEVVIRSSQAHGIDPPRWRWEDTLLGGILEKCKEMRMTPELRELAMFVCLIYSSATPDRVCISTTINLFVGGYTSWKKFAEASAEELKEFTQEAGIDARNDRLIDIAKDIVENHGGRLPSERSVMEEWVGVKGKTASILCNEVHHIPSGIGVDRHVRELETSIGNYNYPHNERSVEEDPNNVE